MQHLISHHDFMTLFFCFYCCLRLQPSNLLLRKTVNQLTIQLLSSYFTRVIEIHGTLKIYNQKKDCISSSKRVLIFKLQDDFFSAKNNCYNFDKFFPRQNTKIQITFNKLGFKIRDSYIFCRWFCLIMSRISSKKI